MTSQIARRRSQPSQRLPVARGLLVLAAQAAIASCSGGSAAPDGSSLSSADGQFVDCSKELRATPYAPGIVATSAGGHFKVTLVDNRPGAADASNPPASWVRGSNTWDLLVTDPSGQAADGLDIQAVPRMPDHNHGTSITPATMDEGQGKYVVSPLYLYMGGYWQVTLNIHTPPSDGGPSLGIVGDSAVFNVCIPE